MMMMDSASACLIFGHLVTAFREQDLTASGAVSRCNATVRAATALLSSGRCGSLLHAASTDQQHDDCFDDDDGDGDGEHSTNDKKRKKKKKTTTIEKNPLASRSDLQNDIIASSFALHEKLVQANAMHYSQINMSKFTDPCAFGGPSVEVRRRNRVSDSINNNNNGAGESGRGNNDSNNCATALPRMCTDESVREKMALRAKALLAKSKRPSPLEVIQESMAQAAAEKQRRQQQQQQEQQEQTARIGGTLSAATATASAPPPPSFFAVQQQQQQHQQMNRSDAAAQRQQIPPGATAAATNDPPVAVKVEEQHQHQHQNFIERKQQQPPPPIRNFNSNGSSSSSNNLGLVAAGSCGGVSSTLRPSPAAAAGQGLQQQQQQQSSFPQQQQPFNSNNNNNNPVMTMPQQQQQQQQQQQSPAFGGGGNLHNVSNNAYGRNNINSALFNSNTSNNGMMVNRNRPGVPPPPPPMGSNSMNRGGAGDANFLNNNSNIQRMNNNNLNNNYGAGAGGGYGNNNNNTPFQMQNQQQQPQLQQQNAFQQQQPSPQQAFISAKQQLLNDAASGKPGAVTAVRGAGLRKNAGAPGFRTPFARDGMMMSGASGSVGSAGMLNGTSFGSNNPIMGHSQNHNMNYPSYPPQQMQQQNNDFDNSDVHYQNNNNNHHMSSSVSTNQILGAMVGRAGIPVKESNNKGANNNNNNNNNNNGSKKKKPAANDDDSDDEGHFPSSLRNPDGSIPAELANLEPKLVAQIATEILESRSTTTWDQIAGLSHAESAVREAVIWPITNPHLFVGVRQAPRGLLLFGPPGTGKTLIARAIATMGGCTFFAVSASALMSKWIGEGEKLVRCLFAVARVKQPSVIFIDEIDSLLTTRCEGEGEASRRVKTEFLVHLDGVATEKQDRVLIVGATNRPDELDEAARRRLEKKLYIPLPTHAARVQMLKICLKSLVQQQRLKQQQQQQQHENQDHHDDNNNNDYAGAAEGLDSSAAMYQMSADEYDEIARRTKGYSGADMKTLCREATMAPIRDLLNPGGGDSKHVAVVDAASVRPVLFADFEKALEGCKSSVAQSELARYEQWNKQFGSFQFPKEDD